jgi:hypothetical protein
MLITVPHPLQNINWFDFRVKTKSIFNILKSTNLYYIVQNTIITTSTSFFPQTFAVAFSENDWVQLFNNLSAAPL